MCEVCEKLRPIECVPGPIDIEKIIKKRDEIHKRLIYLEQTSKSIKYMTELLHLRKKVKERINELAPP
jgi:hypothetical protein